MASCGTWGPLDKFSLDALSSSPPVSNPTSLPLFSPYPTLLPVWCIVTVCFCTLVICFFTTYLSLLRCINIPDCVLAYVSFLLKFSLAIGCCRKTCRCCPGYKKYMNFFHWKPVGPSAGARELAGPPNTNVMPPVYRPRSTGVFPPAMSSPVMTNSPQVGVVKVTWRLNFFGK